VTQANKRRERVCEILNKARDATSDMASFGGRMQVLDSALAHMNRIFPHNADVQLRNQIYANCMCAHGRLRMCKQYSTRLDV
jgi:hypothetical protein